MKRLIIGTLQVAIPVAIIVWLLYSVPAEQYEQLRTRPKHWGLLAASLGLALVAISNTFVRWYLLVRSLNLRFRLRDAFRLGFLGYLLNFVSAGSVGGDLFKAIFIAREQPGRRAEAVATVVVDRLIGLYALLLVTTLATWLVAIPDPSAEVKAIFRTTYIATAVGAIGLMVLLIPGFTTGALSEWLTGFPRVGPLLERLIAAIRMYRNRPGVLTVIGVQSIATHILFAGSVYCLSLGLFTQVPTFAEHLVIVPLSMVTAALPFTPAGFGAFELAMKMLFEMIPAGPSNVAGILVALAFRIVTILVATIGMVYYWISRAELESLKRAAESSEWSGSGETSAN